MQFINTDFVEITSNAVKDDINSMIKAAGYSQRVAIDDLFISMEFSAKNAFNATIKSKAYGIAYYSSNKIELIAIEN